jgi:hypothetical protein
LIDIFSVVVGLVVAASNPAAAQYVSLDTWQPMQGDSFIADTRANIGYLVHEDGSFTSMRIGSGRREVVRYMRRTYNATTPSDGWIVKEIDTQTDRLTFGKDGTFMRLYRDGTEYTSYGIHSVANIDELLATNERYYSMGCVLVDYATLEILLATYKLNGDTLDVLTVDGLTALMTPAKAPMTAAVK